MPRKVTHSEHQKDFEAGYYAAKEEIAAMGWRATAKKWRNENIENPSSLADYYYSDGGLTALAESL